MLSLVAGVTAALFWFLHLSFKERLEKSRAGWRIF